MRANSKKVSAMGISLVLLLFANLSVPAKAVKAQEPVPATHYPVTNGEMVEVNLELGGRIIALGDEQTNKNAVPLQTLYDSMGEFGFCAVNGSFWEDYGGNNRPLTYRYIKNGSEITPGEIDPKNRRATPRAIIFEGENVEVTNDINKKTQGDLIVGIEPTMNDEDPRGTTLAAVKGKTVFLLTVRDTVKSAVELLEAKGVSRDQIVQLDGGGSTGMLCEGITLVTVEGRNIPQGIGVMVPSTMQGTGHVEEQGSTELTIIDQTQESLGVFGRSSCTERTSTEWIVWHQIVNSNTEDGVALARYFANSRVWNAPGYTYFLDDEPLPNGTVKVWQLWPENCGTYGVGENYNFTGLHIAYQDVPPNAPPNEAQLHTLKLLTMQKMHQYGVKSENVIGHKETALKNRGGLGWTQEMLDYWQSQYGFIPQTREIPAACDDFDDPGCISILEGPHSDPVGIQMEQVRTEIEALPPGVSIYVGPNRPIDSVNRLASFAVPCLMGFAILALLFTWLSGDPINRSRLLLQIYARYKSWSDYRKLERELRAAEEKNGLVGIGFPVILATALVVSGFQLVISGKNSTDCNFVPIMGGRSQGDWGFGVPTTYQDFHSGVDIGGRLGEPVTAVASGKVVWADWWPDDPKYRNSNLGHGNTVYVKTICRGKVYYHTYGHLDSTSVKVGEWIEQGKIVGTLGDTGASDGPHVHFEITTKGPQEDYSWVDYVNPNEFIEAHRAPVGKVDPMIEIKFVGFQITGWTLIVFAGLTILFFGESRGLLLLIRQSLIPALYFAVMFVAMQWGPNLAITGKDWVNILKNLIQGPGIASSLPQAEPSLFNGMMELPAHFTQEINLLGPRVVQIAYEENVPAEVPFVIWLKERGGHRNNPSNGEGICGMHSKVQAGAEYFPPGDISEVEVLRQLRLCAKEFRRHAESSGNQLSYSTTDLDILGPIYMAYNGNIDCHGGEFSSWRDHPYVMNGASSEYMGMIARNGQGGCVALEIIGAIPAHIRVGQTLRGETNVNPTTEERSYP